jgi:hypothetical protein
MALVHLGDLIPVGGQLGLIGSPQISEAADRHAVEPTVQHSLDRVAPHQLPAIL